MKKRVETSNLNKSSRVGTLEALTMLSLLGLGFDPKLRAVEVVMKPRGLQSGCH
jgi:hypothetical protein